ncbi:hypothetical protein V6N11_042767 [Hibiscus sabdariffa]|uniref:RNase H type-1 domain-containing protein n=1 Tax=Hibiscus sabdariffa TaxID=183260 RepID=A0ABR2QXC0_9ROSI
MDHGASGFHKILVNARSYRLNHWNHDIRHVELESDNLEVVNILNRSSNTMVSSLLVHDILQLISRSWNVKIRHIPRYKNGVADRLAKLSRDKPSAYMSFDTPPLEVFRFISAAFLLLGATASSAVFFHSKELFYRSSALIELEKAT